MGVFLFICRLSGLRSLFAMYYIVVRMNFLTYSSGRGDTDAVLA